MNFEKAIQFGRQVGDPVTPSPTAKPLSDSEKQNWNKFIQFVSDQKMNNNPDLDRRDKSVGMGLIQAYNAANPKATLPTDIVPRVQTDLQNYRSNLVNQWKQGKLQADVKNESEIMPGISAVDSWPGTKTLSSRFPVAVATVNGAVKDYGVNTQGYDKDRLGVK